MPPAELRKIERNLAAMHRVATHVVVPDDKVTGSRICGEGFCPSAYVGIVTEVAGGHVRLVTRANAAATRPAGLSPGRHTGFDPVMSGRPSAGGCIGKGGLGPQVTDDDDSWWS